MHTQRFQRLLPVAGVLFSITLGVAIVLGFSEPSDTDGVAKVFAYWSHHRSGELAAVLLIHAAAVLLLFFAVGLRAALRSGEAGEASYSAATFGGAVLAAAGFTIAAQVDAATVGAAHQGAVAATYTLNQLTTTDWIPFTAGLTVMLLGAGLGGLRTLALPRALCWTAIVMGALFFTPAGAFAFVLLPLWSLAASIALNRAERRTQRGATSSGSTSPDDSLLAAASTRS